MLYKISLSVNEIPPLFVELSELHQNESKEFDFWKEKARFCLTFSLKNNNLFQKKIFYFIYYFRWIRFEEHAEDVLGRWSKPHVATIPNTAISDLKDLIHDGIMIFDETHTNIKDITGI